MAELTAQMKTAREELIAAEKKSKAKPFPEAQRKRHLKELLEALNSTPEKKQY